MSQSIMKIYSPCQLVYSFIKETWRAPSLSSAIDFYPSNIIRVIWLPLKINKCKTKVGDTCVDLTPAYAVSLSDNVKRTLTNGHTKHCFNYFHEPKQVSLIDNKYRHILRCTNSNAS